MCARIPLPPKTYYYHHTYCIFIFYTLHSIFTHSLRTRSRRRVLPTAATVASAAPKPSTGSPREHVCYVVDADADADAPLGPSSPRQCCQPDRRGVPYLRDGRVGTIVSAVWSLPAVPVRLAEVAAPKRRTTRRARQSGAERLVVGGGCSGGGETDSLPSHLQPVYVRTGCRVDRSFFVSARASF